MKNFTAIDFETAIGKRYSACAIGIVKVVNGNIVERFSTLIQPPHNEYQFHNIKVHQITPEMTEGLPFFPEIYPTIKRYIQNTLVVAHNMEFDFDVLSQTMNFYDIEDDELNFKVDCTLKLFGQSLDKCCEEHHIKLDHHDPLSDAIACAKLYLIHNGESDIHHYKAQDTQYGIPTDGRQSICGDVLKPDLEAVSNKENPFFGKKVVISGTYLKWPDRTDIAKILKEFGADIDTSVTKRTNILIAGHGVGPKKLKDMESNILEGKDAQILDEETLITLLNDLD